MPSSSSIPPNAPNSDSRPPLKLQKELTKAERRELQERQRAAKLASKGGAAPSGSIAKSTPKPGAQAPMTSAPPKRGRRPSESAPRAPAVAPGIAAKDAKISVPSTLEPSPGNARSLRIFLHFGLPKTVSVAKGDIHPAILRLALQFSNFKITGANARCIATLTAFKTVRIFLAQTYLLPLQSSNAGHSRLCNPTK